MDAGKDPFVVPSFSGALQSSSLLLFFNSLNYMYMYLTSLNPSLLMAEIKRSRKVVDVVVVMATLCPRYAGP